MNLRNVAKFKSGSERVFIVVYEEQRKDPTKEYAGQIWYETIMYLDEPRREVIVEAENQWLNDNATILTEDEKKPWVGAIDRAEKVIERLVREHAPLTIG